MIMEPTRWGVIYCPKEGMRKDNQWNSIREYMSEKGVLFDFVQSEGPDSVERLAAMLASNGYSTLIIVGGDGALNRALNGVMSLDDSIKNKLAIGVIPNGWGNDFAHFWDLEEDNYKKTIDALIKRRIRKVDVGCCYAMNGEEQVCRYFLNCVDVGLVASIMQIKYRARRFLGGRIPHFISMFLLLFKRMLHKMHLKVNQDEIDRNIMTVCVGSAHGYGQTPSGVPYNGMLDVSVVSHPEIRQLLEGLWLLFTGRFLNHKAVKSYRTKMVHFYDISKARVAVDGTVWNGISAPIKITIRQECLNFIIP